MLLKWLNIYLGGTCNGSCKYCFRKYNDKVETKLTDEFLLYLQENSVKYARLVFVGGEPLLYFDTIKKICSKVPVFVRKRIMTNGKMLSKDIINFCNDNNIEISLSYDGDTTLENRGYDVIKDKFDLLPLIDNLAISTVITSKNNDVYKTYKEIKDSLGDIKFQHILNIYIDNKDEHDIFAKDFDYNLFRKSLIEYDSVLDNKYNIIKINNVYDDVYGASVLLNGDVVNMLTLKKYGTIFDNEEELYNNIIKDYTKCNNCRYDNLCTMKRQLATKHKCKTMRAIIEAYNFMECKNENIY